MDIGQSWVAQLGNGLTPLVRLEWYEPQLNLFIVSISMIKSSGKVLPFIKTNVGMALCKD